MIFPLFCTLKSPIHRHWTMYFCRNYKDSLESITQSLEGRREDPDDSERSKLFRLRFLNQIKTIKRDIRPYVTTQSVLHSSRDHYLTKLLTEGSRDVKDHDLFPTKLESNCLSFLKQYLQQFAYSIEYPGILQYKKEAIHKMDEDTIKGLLCDISKLRFQMTKWSWDIKNARKAAKRKQIPGEFLDSRKNTFVPTIHKGATARHMRWKMLSGVPQDFPIIVDMQFDKAMSSSSHNDLIAQILCMYRYNSIQSHPIPLLLCNLKESSESYKYLKRMNVMDSTSDYITYTSSSFRNLEGINTDDLIYLTPDASVSLEKFRHDKVYIIGGLVDKHSRTRLTVSLARRASVTRLRFPLSEYLIWGNKSGRMELSLDIVLKILLTLRDTDSWPAALSHISRRFHRGLKNPSLVEHNKELKEWYDIAEATAKQQDGHDLLEQRQHKELMQGYFGIQRHPRARKYYKTGQPNFDVCSENLEDDSI